MFVIETEKYKKSIIAAVSTMDRVDTAIESLCGTIFLLTGSIFNLHDIIDRIHEVDKKVYIDIDLMEGFSKDSTFLKYVQDVLLPDGVITTRSSLAKRAKSMGLFVIQRYFVFDSMSLESAIKTALDTKPDIVEVLPGISAKVIREVRKRTHQSVIGSGLIKSKEDIVNALEAGALGITTSNTELWNGAIF